MKGVARITFALLLAGANMAQAQGFKVLLQKDLRLSAGESVRLRFPLELGAVAETVEVSAVAPLLNTVSAEQRELATKLESALAELPADQRIALLMADVLGYDYLDVAELTGSALGTVKSRISRARARLRAMLLADDGAREHFERYVRP